MKLKLNKPTKMWAFVKDGKADLWDIDKWKPTPGMERTGEAVERILMTVTRVPKQGGRR